MRRSEQSVAVRRVGGFIKRFFADWRLVVLLCLFTAAGMYADAEYGSQARTVVLGTGMGVMGTLMRSGR